MNTIHRLRQRALAPLAVAMLLAGVAGGCQDEAARAEAQAAAQATADEAAAGEAAAAFDAAMAAENWQLAKAQGDVLLARWPDTAAAARVRPQHGEAKARAGEVREAARLASLWSYASTAVPGGQQVSAAIHARDPVDVDGSGARPVQLIFRDHPEWGRSSYLVLKAGDFDCYGSCRVAVSVDDAAATRMAANRPDTDEAIAMFIDDERALWRRLEGTRVLSIEFPVTAGGTRKAVFDVGGLDRARMPGWD
jgi:hypothetical protein